MTSMHGCTAAARRQSIECAARALATVWLKLTHYATVLVQGRAVRAIFSDLPSGAVRVTCWADQLNDE